jgi:hypothetical protein
MSSSSHQKTSISKSRQKNSAEHLEILGQKRNSHRVWEEKSKQINSLVDIDVYGRIILNRA